MNSVEYSKGDLSRARTAEYHPGQSASGPFLNPNQQYAYNLGKSFSNSSRVYAGDASQYYTASQHPAQSYDQYPYRLANSNQQLPRQNVV